MAGCLLSVSRGSFHRHSQLPFHTGRGQLLTAEQIVVGRCGGSKENILERLDWTGVVPFELKEVNAQPDGFLLTFTKPVNLQSAADPASYRIETFTHIYQGGYGSPEVDQTTPTIQNAEVSDDRLQVRLRIPGSRAGSRARD